MNIIERWKPVDGYEELYAVSSLGKVKSLKYDKILKPKKNKDGYLEVCLCRDGKGKMFKVHRLVASAFLPNPKGLHEVNHLNEDKTLNIVTNLEWCSRRYNINFGTRIERMTASLSKPVEASKYSDFREIELRFDSTAEAGRNGFNQGHVSSCCNWCYHREGNNKYKNLYWRYAN